MSAYYNENDPNAAAWLRGLIYEGHIAWGDVDERSIVDVRAGELAGYTQCHFFAGIGGWSHALRLAGWPDDRPVWTGSCPCQPFSVAGAQKGTADERHLWPAWFGLVDQRRPAKIFGEQVEAAVKHGWLDLVYSDLERIGYAVGAAVIPAAGVGAPHIRQRLWFVADSTSERRTRERLLLRPEESRRHPGDILETARGSETSELADAGSQSSERNAGGILRAQAEKRSEDGPQHGDMPVRHSHGGAAGDVGNSERARLEGHAGHEDAKARRAQPVGSTAAPGQLSYWSDADWLPCRDGKARPVEPGTFPLAHGIPGRVVKVRAYGNAIVPQVAAAFIKAAMTP